MNKRKLRLWRALVTWVVEFLAILLFAWLVPGVEVNNLWNAVWLVLIVGMLNAFVRPTLVSLTFPISVYSLGFFSLILNGGLILFAIWLLGGEVSFAELWVAIGLSVWIAAVNTFVSSILNIDDTDSYYRNVARKASKRHEAKETNKPGVLFIEIDGLAQPILLRAIQNAYMPTLSRWLRDSHQLVRWEPDLASSTPGSQSGILLGNNSNVPAFRWFEREEQKVYTMSVPQDVHVIEKKQITNGGLLVGNSLSINNVFSGGAQRAVITSSQLLQQKNQSNKDALYYFFLDPYSFAKSLFFFGMEIGSELKDAAYQRRHDVLPRIHRNFSFALTRAATTVLLRDINVYAVINAMFMGLDSVYATFIGYDEIAHHAGIERDQSMLVLQKIDDALYTIERAIKDAPRPYNIVLLSDHGQSQGATFLQRYGLTLEDYIESVVQDDIKVTRINPTDEGMQSINALATELTDRPGKMGALLRKLTRKNTSSDGLVEFQPLAELSDSVESSDDHNMVVLPSGNLGLVYFKGYKRRLNRNQIETLAPDLLKDLVSHDGIGFVMVRDSRKGPVVISAEGERVLKTGTVTGVDPLAGFGETASHHLMRTDTFENCPDIVINSFYDEELHEVAAYEELVGSHGGLGGYQQMPFLMYPKTLETKKLSGIVGSEQLHAVLKKWSKKAVA